MINHKMLSAAVLAAVLTVGVASAHAADTATEKCFGVARAGKNDCKTAAHACAGHAAKSSAKADFVVLPAGICAKLAHSTTEMAAPMDKSMDKPMADKPMDTMNK